MALKSLGGHVHGYPSRLCTTTAVLGSFGLSVAFIPFRISLTKVVGLWLDSCLAEPIRNARSPRESL